MTQSVLNYKTITDAQNVIDGITESVEKEIKKITSDAANTAEMILKNAGSQCARIKEQAVTDADAREKLILQKGSVQAVHLRKRAGFALRQKVYDEIIRKVRSEVIRIKTMNKSLWKDILNRWAVDAVQNLHGHDAVLFLSKDDLDLIDDGFSETLIKMLSGSEKKKTQIKITADIKAVMIQPDNPGLYASADDGRILFDNTLNKRIHRAEKQILKIIDSIV